MRNKGIVLPLVLLCVLVIISAVLVIFQSNLEPEDFQKSSSFQQLLDAHCEKQDLTVDDLPILVDQNIVEVNKMILFCTSNPETSYVKVNFNNNDSLYLYDDFSEELGHGGEPSLGTVGPIIKDDKDVKVSFFLFDSEFTFFVKRTRMYGRGTKKLLLDNGQNVYASYTHLLIDNGDPRLVGILERYSTPVDEGSNDLSLSKEGYDQAVYNTFFSDLSNLKEPEKTAINQLEQILGAVNAK